MRLSLCNKEFERLTGYTRKEMEGVNLLEKLVHPEDHARLVKNNAKRLAGKKVDHNYEFRWIRKDGETRFIDGSFDCRLVYEGTIGRCPRESAATLLIGRLADAGAAQTQRGIGAPC